MKQERTKCLCGSGKLLEQCCGRFLIFGQDAKTPEQLMRSRYTAFALGGYGDYLVSTWLPARREGLNGIDLSFKSAEWAELRVIEKAQKADSAWVEFKAFFKDGDGESCCHHERSLFKRIDGRWYYDTAETIY
jgi:SEC-C motif-containing protein